MVTCRNCHSSLPDESKFCSVCGYQTQELPIIPFPGRNVPYDTPGFTSVPGSGSEGQGANLASAVSGWGHASPTEAFSYPVHGSHHQPLLIHGDHHQPLSTYGNHHQALPAHADHYQPLVQNEYRRSWLTMGVSSLVVVSIVAMTFFVVFFANNKNKTPAPTITPSNLILVISGKAIPGQTLQVVGNNFPPAQDVFVTVDDQPLAKNGAMTYTWRSSALSLSHVSLSSATSRGTPVTVQADGTLTIQIRIDVHWAVGSTHHIRVENQQGKELKSLDFIIESDPLAPTPTAQASGTAATGTVMVVNHDPESSLYLPAGTMLTNTAGCTAQGLQVSLDRDVNLGAYGGNGDYPQTTVSVHVVKPGATGNIRDCPSVVSGSAGDYAFNYCNPACDTAVWVAYDMNGGFTGGADSSPHTANVGTGVAPNTIRLRQMTEGRGKPSPYIIVGLGLPLPSDPFKPVSDTVHCIGPCGLPRSLTI